MKFIQSMIRILGMENDIKLNFEKHILNICKKVYKQLNPICRIQKYIDKEKEKEAVIKTLVH